VLHWKESRAISSHQLASQLSVWNCRTNRWTPHTTHDSSPTSWENNPAQLLSRLNQPPGKLKNINNKLQSNADSRSGGGTLNLPWRMGVEQRTKLSAPNSQWTNVCKTAKAESRSGVTSQPPKAATTYQQKLGKAQRLRAWVGQQTNLQKQGRWWIPELISQTEGSIQNWIAPPCWRRTWPNRVVAEGQLSSCQVKRQFWSPCMNWQSYFTWKFQIILLTEGTKCYSQASHLVRPHQCFCL
jgi:hypothetical protein